MEDYIYDGTFDCGFDNFRYQEQDTGFKFYDCDLTGCECVGWNCPLNFKYKVEE